MWTGRCGSSSSTPTSSAPTATEATGWCSLGGPSAVPWRSSSSRPRATSRCRRPTSTPWAAARTARRSGRPRAWRTTAGWPGRSPPGPCVLAVCAGYQILGTSFPAADGTPVPGLGLLDVVTREGPGPPGGGRDRRGRVRLGVGLLTGFENHGGTTTLGPGTRALGRVRIGVGNGGGTDGACRGRVVGTYLHGPVLARNPALADLLLAWAIGADELAPLEDRRGAGAAGRAPARAALGRHRVWWPGRRRVGPEPALGSRALTPGSPGSVRVAAAAASGRRAGVRTGGLGVRVR